MGDNKKIEIITNITELTEFVDSEDGRCLIVLDMDDVVIRGSSLGSDSWFHQNLKEKRDIMEVLDNMGYAYSLIEYHRVEDNTKDVLTDVLTRDNVDYIVMTSRGIMHYSQTLKHLREAGMSDLLVRSNMLKFEGADDLEVHGVCPNPDDPVMYPKLRQVRYTDNICFCSGTPKDLVLEEIVHRVHKESKHRYKKIIFIDDSIQNVNTVHNSFIRPQRKNLYRGMKTYSIHYSAMEVEKRRYNSTSLVTDDQKMRYIRNVISHINGRVRTDYITSLNVLLGFSLLWWFAFRFLGIIGGC